MTFIFIDNQLLSQIGDETQGKITKPSKLQGLA